MIKYLLVTGGAGFIGGNFLHYIMRKDESLHVINLDKFTYAASADNIAALPAARHTLVRGDICDAPLLGEIFSKRHIEGVINFAAQSHVDNSISAPEQFIKTNTEGAFCLLEAARKAWLRAPHEPKDAFAQARFLQISTDEVYGSLGGKGLFKETSPYAPNSPYSASKAAADMLARVYHKTYGLNAVVSRSSNNFGPFQHEEKFIPAVIKNALNGTPIPLYGDGRNVRDWLYVEDHCRAIELVFKKGRAGESYNIGGRHELQNHELAIKICALLDEIHPGISGRPYAEQIVFTADRPGHDRRYGVNCSKIKKELGWAPARRFDAALKETVEFYLAKYKNEPQRP
jgi:dTDP-glucose 4,6-dehydratase